MAAADNAAGAGELTPEAATAEIEAMESSATVRDILLTRDHPQHRTMVDRRSELYRMKHSEPAPRPASTGPAAPVLAPDAARAAIAEMEADPEAIKALLDRAHPRHRTISERRHALYLAAYPEPAADGAQSEITLDPAMAAEAAKHYDMPIHAPDEPAEVMAEAKTAIGGWAYTAGLTPQELRDLVNIHNTSAQGGGQYDEAGARDVLRAMHGAQTDAVLAAARRAVAKINDPRLVALLNETGLGNDPTTISTLAAAARRRGW